MGIITSERLLKSKYDVIVIGAGIGGLTTASLLAKSGVDVLLIEQHSVPGGACTSFRRNDRTYDCGAALIFGFGKDGYHLHRNLINILEEPVAVIPRDKFFRLDFAGQQIIVWKDLQKYLPELERQFPEERDEIKTLYDFLIRFYEKYVKDKDLLTPPSELSTSQRLRMLFSSPMRTLKLGGLLSSSAAELMCPYIKSRRLLEFFDKLCASYAYVTMEEMPAIMALTMFTDNHAGGTYYVAGSAQTYSNTLERALERNGGTVLYLQRVEKIVFEGNKACGVKLVDGTIIHADRVVADTTVWNLYRDLIPPERVTAEQKEWANSLVPTYPAMVLYAAVDQTVFPSDTNAVEYYVSDTSQIEMGDITLYIPTIDDHTLGPPGEHIVTVFSPAPDQKWPRPFEEEYQSPAYMEKKQKQADLILQEIQKRIPNFRRGIKELHIATPSTIERYTLKTWGCVGGPKQMIGQELTKRLHAKTAWPGLYACGDSTTMGMGMPAVTASGFGAANIILRELGKPEYHNKPFTREYVKYIQENPRLTIPTKIEGDPEKARLIARECQYCENPPCKTACPAGIDIPGFIRRIEAGNHIGAARVIRETNPLPEICGHICPSEKLCERACVRTTFAPKPVQIRELHRWVAKYAGEDGWSHSVASPSGKTVGIIGAGPVGLSCAHYLARLGYAVDLYDSSDHIGGSIQKLVDGNHVPQEVLSRELNSMVTRSIEFHGKWILTDKAQLDKLQEKHDALFVAVESVKDFKTENVKSSNKILLGNVHIRDPKTPHGLVEALYEGRQAAMTMNEMIVGATRKETAETR